MISEAAILLQVILIDIALSGDNAVVIGMAAAGLEEKQRKKAILFGMAFAIILRVAMSLLTIQLLNIPGLMIIGGMFLLLVAWGMFKDIRADGAEEKSMPKHKTMLAAITQIIVADLSMSLDNVLAVAGAATSSPAIMAFGLVLSIGLMGVAANYIAKILNKWPLLNYVGLGLILYVAGSMIYKEIPLLLEGIKLFVTEFSK